MHSDSAFVTVNCGGALLNIPSSDFNNAAQMRWWLNDDLIGDDAALESRIRIGWQQYSGCTPPQITWRIRLRKRIRQYCWDHVWALRVYCRLAMRGIRIGAR